MSQPDFSAMSRMVETTMQALDKARGAPTGDGEGDGLAPPTGEGITVGGAVLSPPHAGNIRARATIQDARFIGVLRARGHDCQRWALRSQIGAVEGEPVGVPADGWRNVPWRITSGKEVRPDLDGIPDARHVAEVQARGQVGVLECGELETPGVGWAKVQPESARPDHFHDHRARIIEQQAQSIRSFSIEHSGRSAWPGYVLMREPRPNYHVVEPFLELGLDPRPKEVVARFTGHRHL